MAANILNSQRAVQMSIFVVRAFAKMREALRGTPELARKLAALEKKLTSRLDAHEAAIVQVLREVMQILNPPPPPPEPPRRRIGFHQSCVTPRNCERRRLITLRFPLCSWLLQVSAFQLRCKFDSGLP
jgi:hypothetical protein